MIPRTALPEKIGRMAAEVEFARGECLPCGRRQFAPDGVYDQAIPGQEEIALDLSYRILYLCVEPSGGSTTGRAWRRARRSDRLHVSPSDLETMQRVRRALDPENIANPDKVFSRPSCAARRLGRIRRIR